ncbi:MAG: aminotransferase class V-fold PLP-dependent enzyme [Aestuariibacter sp.]
MLKHHYQRFIKANPALQHYACHSHHYWPDVTRQAILEYWDDAAELIDNKWERFFTDKVPRLQQYIAELLNTGQPEQLAFANNTHELLFRVMSSLDFSKPISIVTTDSEFHSFTRQVNRLDELGNVTIHRVATEPFDTFEERFIEQVNKVNPDVVFFSQVFFNSGVAVNSVKDIVTQIDRQDAIVMVDGYHAFCALPIDISAVKQRIFYLAGGYKYAQGGEGVCFMHCPKNLLLRPLYTGWFAEFGELQKFKSRKVDYARNGFHYAGGTMDLSGVYRQLAVFDLWQQEQVTVAKIHQHVQKLQNTFLEKLDDLQSSYLNSSKLVCHDLRNHGHFLSFRLPGEDAARLHQHFKTHNIWTDYRGPVLRFGFACYHEEQDIDIECLKEFQGD